MAPGLPHGSSSNRKRHRSRKSSGVMRQSGRDTLKKDLENFLQDRVVKTKNVRRREKIITEIFASERRYQEQLGVVVEVFMKPLKNRRVIPEGVYKTIFGDLTAIQSINKELLAHMEETSIGKAFMMLAPYIKLYCTYANNFDNAMMTLQEWERKMSDFNLFLREQEARPECRSLSLHAMLITPVQRVPRYKMLLEQLLSHTPSSDEDYNNLQEAAHLIGQVTMGINEYIREHDNFQKMLEIQKKLCGPGTPKILIPGRRFLREGQLMKVSRKGFGSHERMFFLFSDLLIYAKPNMVLERPLSTGIYTFRLAIPLEVCEVKLVLGEKKIKNSGALFRLSFGGDSLLLYSTDNQEAIGWIDAIQSAKETLKSNMASLRRTSSVAMEALNEVIQPLEAETPLRYGLRSRNKQKLPTSQKEISPKNKDSLYPMRKQVLKSNMMNIPPPQDSIPDVPVHPSEPQVVMRSKRSRSRGQSPLSNNKRQRRSSGAKKRRLQRGPLPFKQEQPDDPDVFVDAPNDPPDTTRDFTFHSIYECENTDYRKDTLRRRSYRCYDDEDTSLNYLGSTVEDKEQQMCIIL